MAPTTRTCSFALLTVLALSAPAEAKRVVPDDSSRLSTFVGARAAALSGNLRRSALLYASLAEREPGNEVLADRAISGAIAAGDTKLAVRLASRRKSTELEVDARLLLIADNLARGRERQALNLLREDQGGAHFGFLTPLLQAWIAAERGDSTAFELINQVPGASPVAPYLAEHRALILLRQGKREEAEPIARRAIGVAGRREARVRIALADGFMRLGDRSRAVAMLEGRDTALAGARRAIEAGRKPGHGIRTPAEALSETLVALGLDLRRSEAPALAAALVQVARHASPVNPQAPVILGLLLDAKNQEEQALAALRSVPDESYFASEARDVEVRNLLGNGRRDEALARAQAFLANGEPRADDFTRLGDVLSDMGRHAEAAAAFGRALALVANGGPGPEVWTLHLLRGGELEQADQWPAARQALEAALALAPNHPLVLNYLGYAKLERGETPDQAEQLIAKASQLAPDNASITDSLGWAQFKRGRIDDAISTLQRAALADPAQAEIHEHLGDALYTAGRRFEARHFWSAALITAEDDVKKRLQGKIEAGLTSATAAP